MNVTAVLTNSVISPLFISISGMLLAPGHFASESLIQKEFTEKQRATMASINSLASSILFAIFALAMGMLADKVGPVKTLFIIQLFGLIPMFISWKVFQRIKS